MSEYNARIKLLVQRAKELGIYDKAARIMVEEQEKVAQRKLHDQELFNETILVEPIVMWKGLSLYGTKLASNMGDFIWEPLKPVEAKCDRHTRSHEIGMAQCSCGIYGAEEPSEANSYGKILTKCSYWGMFVRGDKGIRAQFAYPYEIYLKPEQDKILPELMQYRVPIYQLQPVMIYNPKEDGYEYWNGEENRNGDPSEEPDSDESDQAS